MAEVSAPADPDLRRRSERAIAPSSRPSSRPTSPRSSARRAVRASIPSRQRTSRRPRSRPLSRPRRVLRDGPASGRGSSASCTRRSPRRAGRAPGTGRSMRSTRPLSVGSMPQGVGAHRPSRSTPTCTARMYSGRSSPASTPLPPARRWPLCCVRSRNFLPRTSVTFWG